jgi:hypothetical protein
MIRSIKRGNPKFLASILTVAIITMIIAAGPAYAWQVNLQEFSNTSPIKGEIITSKFNIKFQQETKPGLDRLVVYLDGPESTICYFNIHGKPLPPPSEGNNDTNPGNPNVNLSLSNASSVKPVNLSKIKLVSPHNNFTFDWSNATNSGDINSTDTIPAKDKINDICKNLGVKMITLEDYGYGYGYGYGYNYFDFEVINNSLAASGNLPYLLTINTGVLNIGEYKAKVSLWLDGNNKETHDSETRLFTVIAPLNPPDDGGGSSGGGGHHRKDKNETSNQTSELIPLSTETPTDNPGESTPEQQKQQGFFSRITGAVIGVLGTTGTAIIGVVIAALIVGTAGLQIRKRYFKPSVEAT